MTDYTPVLPPNNNASFGVDGTWKTATKYNGQTLDLRVHGKTGLKQFSGFLFEEYVRELQGLSGHLIYREMKDSDPVIAAVLRAIEMVIRKVKWHVEPYSSAKGDQEIADFLNSVLLDMSLTWPDTIAELLSFLPFGFAPFEILYKQRKGQSNDPTKRSIHKDGLISWRKLSIRAQDTLYRWEFDDEGGVMGMWQVPPPTYELLYIPIQKMLLFRTEIAKGNPEGASILRGAYLSWYHKKNIQRIEAIGIERDLAGLPIIYVPSNVLSQAPTAADQQMKTQLEHVLQNVRRDDQEGILLPSDRDEEGNLLFEMKLLSTAGSRQFDTDKVINRYDKRIATSVLADFILLGQEAVGSFALAQVKDTMFGLACEAWLNSMSAVIMNHGFKRLLALNGMPVERMGQLKHSSVRNTSLEQVSALIQAIGKAGGVLFPNKRLLSYLSQQTEAPLDEQDGTPGSSMVSDPDGGDPDLDDDQSQTGSEGKSNDLDDNEKLNKKLFKNIEAYLTAQGVL